MQFISHGWQWLLRSINGMHTSDWTYVFVALVVFGALCMQGFGKSRL